MSEVELEQKREREKKEQEELGARLLSSFSLVSLSHPSAVL